MLWKRLPDERDLTGIERFFSRLVANPQRALAAFAAFHVLCWTLLPLSVATSPRLDVVEGLVWGREWLLGTFKHPPLPAWLIEISLAVTGSPLVGPTIAAQACVVATYFLVFRIGLLVTTPRTALIGTCLLAGTFYFTWPTPELNHNVVQLPIWAGAVLLLLIAQREAGKPLPWLALGALAGIGFYAKHSVLVLYFAIAVWILLEPRLRRALATPWPWIGAAIGIAILSPHLFWLWSSDLTSIGNVRQRGGDGSVLSSIAWLMVQLADHAALLVFAAIVGFRLLSREDPETHRSPEYAFVLYFALAPALMTAVVATVVGNGLLDMWGMPMFTLAGLAIAMTLNRAWSDYVTGRVVATAMGFTLVIAAAYAAFALQSRGKDHLARDAWPMKEIANQARDGWYAHADKPLRVISGDFWIAGLIANGVPERPTVVYGGSLERSPWIDGARLETDGILHVWEGADLPAWLASRAEELKIGTIDVPGRLSPGKLIGYAVQLPRTAN